MKKNYFSTLFAALMLFLAMPATAQVASVADLFGKYKFTADVETLDNSYTGKFSGDCEVTIGKDQYNIYDGVIYGFAGLSGRIVINSINEKQDKAIFISSPNTGLGAEGLYMSDIKGEMNIFTGDSTQYGDLNFAFDPITKNFTLPDFSLVTKDGSQKVDAIVAKFTNAKLTLLEAEAIEVADLSGKWHYTAGKGTYDTMEGSTLPLEWDMTLTATNETNSAYDISLVLGDFDPLALTAKFDGAKLVIPFDSIFFDTTNRISLWDPYGGRYKGDVEFNLVNENTMTLSMMYIRQDSISPEVKGGALQYYMNGLAKRQGAEEVATTWDGTYKVKGTLAHVAIKDYDYPTEFDVKVVYNEAADMYLITEFMGNDVTALNYGGIRLTPSADDPNKAEIATGKYLQTIVSGESYLCLKDMNLGDSPLTLTRKEDGTYEISDFSVSYMTYDEANNWAPKHALAAFYQEVTAEKEAVEEFSWATTFTVKVPYVTVCNKDYTFPSEFEVEVQYMEEWGIYLVTKFLGNDVTALNNGGIGFSVSAEDPNKAVISAGNRYLQSIVAGQSYLCLKDKALGSSALTLTHNEDGTITISDFCISLMTYEEAYNQGHTLAAYYHSEPVITLTAEVTDAERTFEFGSAIEGENKISIDWGNGTIVEGAALFGIYDGWDVPTTAVTGTPKGTGEIKIYATGGICYFDCVSKVDGPGITALDVSKATELTELYANGNKLTSVDLSMLSKLEKLELNNNSLSEVSLQTSLTSLNLENNKLTTFDGSKLTAISTLRLSNNNLGTLDVSNMPSLKTLYALDCSLTSFTVGALTTKKATISVKNNDTISANNNLLKTLDLSEAIGLENGYLYAENNELTEIKFPDVTIKRVNIQGNKFTLATIPATAKTSALNYAPQQDMVIEDIKETIDLSAQNNLVGLAAEAQATVYTWLTEAGDTLVAGVDYTEEAGKFTFIKEQAQKVYCTMSTAAFPKFTGSSIFKTVAVAVTAAATGIDSMEASVELTGDIYAVDGKLIKRNASVADMPKGLYIVKTAAGKAIKVIRK